LVAANDDACCSLPIIQLLQRYREAKVPVEMHMYAKGDHAFNMGTNRKLISINNWPQRLSRLAAGQQYIAARAEEDLALGVAPTEQNNLLSFSTKR
jgi:acetyl esterase/lipase